MGAGRARLFRAALPCSALLCSALLFAPRARACGVSASGVSSCSLVEHDEAVRPHWAAFASGLYTSTRLRFSGGLHADQVRYASLASLAYLPSPRLVLELGVGAAFGGSLSLPEGQYEFSAGPTAAFGADYRAFDDGRYFVLLTSSLSFAAARTHLGPAASVGYEAFDLRLGTELGVELARLFRPYLALRAFGGPVYWRHQGQAVTGTDTHHYQVGAGTSVRLTHTVNLIAEGVPLGERAVSLGIGLTL